MTGTKKTRPVTSRAGGATINCGQQLLSTPILHRNCPKVNRLTTTNELADLRRRYGAAVAAERWQDAAALQRQYYDAERRRRQQLLAQAREVGR